MAEITCAKCGKVCKTLQGWKSHNSSVHGGYNDDELAAAAGIAPPGMTGDVRSRMSAMADALPVDPESLPEFTEGQTAPPQQAAPASAPPPKPPKSVKFNPKYIHKIMADIPEKVLQAQSIELDDDDKDALQEVSEFLTDVFGFEFQVPESKYVVTNRLWVIPMVVFAVLLIVVKHKAPLLWKLLTEEKPDGKKTASTK